MKNFIISFIGLVVLLGGMHVMPVQAMGQEETMPIKCSFCIQENQINDNCNDVAEKNHAGTYNLSSADGCNCYFDSDENNHHTGMLQTSVQFSKVKGSPVNGASSLWATDIYCQQFILEPAIHAPPTDYIGAIGSIRQLK